MTYTGNKRYRPMPKKPHNFKYSVKDAIKSRSLIPEEDTDYFICKQFDCAVVFEIHVTGSEDEEDIDIQCRAYDEVTKSGNLECLGVMAKEPQGTLKVDIDNNPFDEEKWKLEQVKEIQSKRREIPLTGFFSLGI